ncbi:hypothetical protein MUO79_11620 [Candidatus Bathyarchaeota archaeon]|nr:hypothetical protein [Candidatus Bathyarchaeota archaeon]
MTEKVRHPLHLRFYCTRPDGSCSRSCMMPIRSKIEGSDVQRIHSTCIWLEVVNEVALAKGN